MRITRGSKSLPGVETVEVEGHGAFNFVEGFADVSEETAKLLCDKAGCKLVDAPRVVVPGGPDVIQPADGSPHSSTKIPASPAAGSK